MILCFNESQEFTTEEGTVRETSQPTPWTLFFVTGDPLCRIGRQLRPSKMGLDVMAPWFRRGSSRCFVTNDMDR